MENISFVDDPLVERIFSNSDGGDEERIAYWKQGIGLFGLNEFKFWFLGHGFTSTMGQKLIGAEFLHHHFESAFFASFYENGLFSLLYFTIPFWSLFLFLLRRKLFNENEKRIKKLVLVALLCFYFIFLITPGGIHYTSLMSFSIISGLVFNFTPFLSQLRSETI